MTATTIRVQMAQRKDTAANWTAANPILLSGEIGYETDTKKFKIGNGSTNWNSLAYLPIPDGSGNLTITGNLEIGSTGSLTFEGSTADGFETTLAVTNPTADRTITLPDRSGTVITSGDTGTVTSTMILDGTIVNGDVNASAAIAGTKITPDFGAQTITTTGVVSAAVGAAATPSITFTGDTNTGIYSPGADQVAISTGGSGRLFVNATGEILAGTSASIDGNWKIQANAVAGALTGIGVNNNGDYGVYLIYDNSARYSGAGVLRNIANSPLAFETNNTERLRITSAGLVGVGASSPAERLDVAGNIRLSGNQALIFQQSSGVATGAVSFRNSAGVQKAAVASYYNVADEGAIEFIGPTGSTNMLLSSSGRVGIGTTSPASALNVVGNEIRFSNSVNASFYGAISHDAGTTGNNFYDVQDTGGHVFRLSGTERARIDSSGRLLVGTSSARSNLYGAAAFSALFQLEGAANDSQQRSASFTYNNANAASPILALNKTRGTTVGSNTIVQSGDELGVISFQGADGTNLVVAARIIAEVDGTPGANDMPGRLVFSTTADGASAPTEAMRITNAREVCIGTTAAHVANRNALENATTGQLTFRHSGATAGQYNIVGMNSGSAFVVADSSGTTGVQLAYSGTSWSTLSDERHKTGLMPIDNGLAKVGSLRAVTGRLVTDPESKSRSFLIAQDVQAVLPQAVDTTDPDALALSYTEVIPLLVAALKESKERIETLEAKVAALESA